MIILTQTSVRNRVSNSFVWTTDEGNITYILYMRPIISGTTTNPYYQSISITSAEATVVGTVWTYNLTETDLRKMYGTQVSYIWWIQGTSTTGTSIFLWKPNVTNLEWSINKYPTEIYSSTLILTGSYTGFIDKVLVNNEEAETISGIWRCTVELTPGVNHITVVAYDKWDCVSETKTIKITSYQTNGYDINIETVIDQISIVTGNIRKNREDIYTFSKYRLQSLRFRGNSTQRGLVFGLSTELRKQIYNAITVDILPNNPYGCSKILLKVDNMYTYCSTDKMIYEETFIVTDTLYKGLYKIPTMEKITVMLSGKVTDNYEIENNIILFDRTAIGAICRITYNYCERISKNQTLQQTLADLNEIEGIDAYFIDSITNTDSSYGLIQTGWTNNNILLYSDIQIYPAGLDTTQNRFSVQQETILEYDINAINPTLTYIWPGQEMYGIATELKNRRGYGWSNIVLGVSYWTLESYRSNSLLPQILDTQYRRYGSYIPPVAERLSVTEYTGIVLFKGGVIEGLEVRI